MAQQNFIRWIIFISLIILFAKANTCNDTNSVIEHITGDNYQSKILTSKD